MLPAIFKNNIIARYIIIYKTILYGMFVLLKMPEKNAGTDIFERKRIKQANAEKIPWVILNNIYV